MIQFTYFSNSNIHVITRELEKLSKTHDIIHFSLSSVNEIEIGSSNYSTAFQKGGIYHYCIVQYKSKENINIGSLR
jgi:hypothetical protein